MDSLEKNGLHGHRGKIIEMFSRAVCTFINRVLRLPAIVLVFNKMIVGRRRTLLLIVKSAKMSVSEVDQLGMGISHVAQYPRASISGSE